MKIRRTLRRKLRPYRKTNAALFNRLKEADVYIDAIRHYAAGYVPQIIQPDPKKLYIALTSNCNHRCKGCLYGRDFMHGTELPLQMVKDLLDDAKAVGFERVRLYGGEPLLHSDLPEIVAYTANLNLGMWVTTNGLLLRKRIDELVEAGLRQVSIGFYGIGEAYNEYVQRRNSFAVIEEGIAYTREKYGRSISMHLDWLLMRPTGSLESLRATWEFARRYQMAIYVNLIHYSLPYFTEGEKRELQFTPEDRPQIEELVAEMLRLEESYPGSFLNSKPGLRSIPDWLIKGPEMRVPCTEYRLVWVGPDGTVQMCYVTFKLGNLHEKRLAEMMFSAEHKQAAMNAFLLNCPNCHCSYDMRVRRHFPSRQLYGD